MLLFDRDNSAALDLGFVQEFISGTILGQYCQFATIALLVYDTMITLDREVEFFWGRPLTKPVNLMFFLNRYIGIFGAITRVFGEGLHTSDSKFSAWAFDISSWISIILVDYILMIRVLALYQRPRSLFICLIVLLGLEAAVKLGLVVYGTLSQQIFSESLTASFSLCNAKTVPPLSLGIIDWTVPMMYGLILMLLALYKAAEHWRLEAGLKGFKLVKVLIRDQMIYFLLAVLCSVLNIVVMKVTFADEIVSMLLQQAGNPSFLSILGSRLLFNLKEAGKLGVNEGTNYRIRTLSNIEFEQPVANEVSTDEETLHTRV